MPVSGARSERRRSQLGSGIGPEVGQTHRQRQLDVVTRGDLWWVDSGDPVGSAPGYRRPAVVVSSDRFNRSRLATVAVAAVTSNLRLAAAQGTSCWRPSRYRNPRS
ncbi:MAG: type II toxin-antitoxin system PemK/MazF family toxin [Actinomycetota bacterium]|nr:type II toxin-antitoxin system PemK/MazF family toxin [Actinomycetota bacterium]